jgi:hypothetical protein
MMMTYIVSETICFECSIEYTCERKESFQLGLFNFLSMFGSNTALNYVSYPLSALMKSCKLNIIFKFRILSILLVGLLLGKANFSKQQYACGTIITLGIFIFNYAEVNILLIIIECLQSIKRVLIPGFGAAYHLALLRWLACHTTRRT